MGLFDGLGDMLSGLRPGGIPPQAAPPNPSPLSAASDQIGGIVRGLGAPPAAVPGGGVPPASAAAGQGVGSPASPGAPGGAATPPDLSSLYAKLLGEERSRRDVDSGMALIAAGIASPSSRAALINYAGRPQDQEGSASQQLATLTSLYNNSLKQQQYKELLARAPAIAKQLNVPIDQVVTMAQQGKLPDLLEKRSEVKGEVVKDAAGRNQIVDVQHGTPLTGQFGVSSTELPTEKQRVLEDANNNPQKYGLPPVSDISPEAVAKRATFKQGLFTPNVVTINNAQETEYQRTLGGGMAKSRLGAIDEGKTNRQLVNNLDVLTDSLNRADATGNLTTGPFAQKSLEMKEALGSAFGVTIPGVKEAEVAQHIQTQIATQAAKALSARPSQMEFTKFLQNTPGASMSPEGMRALVDVTKQEAQARIAISDMAADQKDKRSLSQIESDYYRDHPILSPFDHSKPLGTDDILKLSPPPQPYIDKLRSGQGKPEDFDKRFGPGASQRYLNSGAAPSTPDMTRMRLSSPLSNAIGPNVPPRLNFGGN